MLLSPQSHDYFQGSWVKELEKIKSTLVLLKLRDTFLLLLCGLWN
jgi:hypothetical protein